MPPPTPLTIATSALSRLLNEESSYSTELATQQTRLAALEHSSSALVPEDADVLGNREFEVGQQGRAIEETKAMFGLLRGRIEGAVERVEGILESGAAVDEKEGRVAREVVGRARGRESASAT